jgi:hypothetical protein
LSHENFPHPLGEGPVRAGSQPPYGIAGNTMSWSKSRWRENRSGGKISRREAPDVQVCTMTPKAAKKPPKTKSPRGPKPDLLKIESKWQDAVKKSFVKKKPVEGWPK